MADSNIVPIKAPTENALEELLKRGARDLLAAAIEAEVSGSIPITRSIYFRRCNAVSNDTCNY